MSLALAFRELTQAFTFIFLENKKNASLRLIHTYRKEEGNDEALYE